MTRWSSFKLIMEIRSLVLGMTVTINAAAVVRWENVQRDKAYLRAS